MPPSVKIVHVTKAQAEKWLDQNTRNRQPREHRIGQYALAMHSGDWHLTGDCIVFDENDVLLNGQHRLAAVALSGLAQDFVVLRGLPIESQDVMDRGLGRSVADALKMRGEAYASALAAALVWMHRLDYSEATEGLIHYASSELRPTLPVLLRLLEAEPGLREAVKQGVVKAKASKVRPGAFCAIYYRAGQLDAEDAAMFFDKLETGEQLVRGDPILALRAVLSPSKTSQKRAVPDYYEAAWVIRAWNHWRDGTPVERIHWRHGGSSAEMFPIMH